MDRKELAMKLHKQGFNCAQCVVCSYCGLLGYDPVIAFKMAEGFGFGMGTAGTCGAVSGMSMVIGMKTSDGNLDHPGTKKECYDLMRRATGKFLSKNKSITCSEIKGMGGGPALCSCDDCIKDAIGILDELLLGIKE